MPSATSSPVPSRDGVSFEVLDNTLLCSLKPDALRDEFSSRAAGEQIVHMNGDKRHLIVDLSSLEHLRGKDDVGTIASLLAHQRAANRAFVVVALGDVARRLESMFHRHLRVAPDRSTALEAVTQAA